MFFSKDINPHLYTKMPLDASAGLKKITLTITILGVKHILLQFALVKIT